MLKNRLFRSYLIRLQTIALVPLILITLAYYYFSMTGQKNSLLRAEVKSFENSAESFDDLFKNILSDSSSIFYIPEIHFILLGTDIIRDDEKVIKLQDLERRLKYRFDHVIHSVEVYFKNTGLIVKHDSFDIIDADTRQDPHTYKALRNIISPQSIWVPQHQVNYTEGGPRQILTYIQPLPIGNEDIKGALIVNIDAVKLLNISSLRNKRQEDFIVLDRERNIIFGNTDSSYLKDRISYKKLQAVKSSNTVKENVKFDNRKMLVFYKASEINKWIYVKTVPYSYTVNDLQLWGPSVYIFIFIIIIISMTAGYKAAKKLYRPLGQVSAILMKTPPVNDSDEYKASSGIKNAVKQIADENSKYRSLFGQNREFLKGCIIKEFLLDKRAAKPFIKEHLSILGLEFPHHFFCVFLFQLSKEELDIKEEVLEVLKKVIESRHVSDFVFIRHDCICAVINLENDGATDRWEYLWKLGNECNRAIRKKFDTAFTIGISVIQSKLEGLSTCYETAEKALSYRHCFERGALIFNHMISQNKKNVFVFPYKQEELLFEYLRQAKLEESIVVLDRIFNGIKAQARFFTWNYLKLLYMELFNSFNRNSILKGIPWDDGDFEALLDEICSNEKSIDEVKEIFAETIKEIVLRMNKRFNVKAPLEKATEYINNNYTKDISLDELAEITGLTPQYFSKVFKDYRQNTFVNYITDLRMEKSVELLTKTDMSVKKISDKVGYRNPQYFIRVFKKKFQLSPMQYKRRYYTRGVINDKV